MDYDSTDRYMSSWVVSCVHNGTRFYLTDDGMASDRLDRAYTARWEDTAYRTAESAKDERHAADGSPVWAGFDWQPVRVAEVMASRA